VEQRTAGDFAIVVVGASYGGIEAMERLFADLPAHIPRRDPVRIAPA
jgi:chemotaxis response regulator CheB